MQDWQQRVIDEKQALDDNIQKLDAHLRSKSYDEMPPGSAKWLLIEQLVAMKEYSLILGKRIALFTEDPD